MRREELEGALNRLAADAKKTGGWGREKWTRKTKKLLVCLGDREKYQTCATKIEAATWSTEWLYDVVWLKASAEFLVRDVILVAEIEWGNERDVWDAFQKLPLARADYRVMIFDDKPGLRGRLMKQARKFGKRGPGDRYFLASYADGEFTVYEEVARRPEESEA